MSKTPKLRFKEFSGDWEEKKLEEISSKIGDGIHTTPSYIDNSEIKFINGNNIKNHKVVINENTKSISKEEYEKYNIKLNNNSILMSINGTIGNVGYYNNEKVLLGKSVAYININSSYSNRLFIGSLLETNKVQQKLINELTGSTIKNLSLKSIRECKLYLPLKEEQEKIASFFSLIDDKIYLQDEKLKMLKDYKNGMMQKIFSRELRFKDDEGRDYPEWEEKKLSKLGETYTGLSGKTKDNFGIGEGKYVIYKNVFANTIAKEEEVELVEINSGENQNNVIKGDLLFTTSSETPCEVGMVSCWNYDSKDLYLNSFCFGYRLFDLENVSHIYLSYLLRSNNYRRKISILAQGSTRYNISKNELMKIKVGIPVIEEQNKIVNLLLNLESKIEKEQEKLDSLNRYKKGLLQQMFV